MPKKGRAATPLTLKPQQPKRELRHKEQYNVLASELCAQKASLQLELEQQHQAQERQKVLVDIINSQEELTRILQYHHSLLQQTSCPAASEAIASPPAGLISGNNRFNRVLAAAPGELIKQVISLQQPEDITRLVMEHFKEQVMLLELASREPPAVNLSPLDIASTTGVTPPACKEPSTDSLGHVAATAAEGGGNDAASPGVEDTAIGGHKHSPSALQQLEQLIQQGMCLVGLALLHNPVPYYISATCNYLTGQVGTVPPQHVMRVLSRLHLSDLQLLHLRIVIEESERLSRDAHGGQLSEQIARLSLQQLVEDVTQQQQAQYMHEHATGTTVVTRTITGQNIEKPSVGDVQGLSVAAAAAAEVAADEKERQQLMTHMSRYLGRIDVHSNMTTWFIINTLTIRQVAILIVASFPYAPAVYAVAEAAKQLHKQRQEERLARIAPRVTDKELQETGEAPGDGSSPPPAAAATERQQAQQPTESDAQCDAFDREVAEYMERRNVMLQQQVQQWWLDIGALP